MLKATIDADTFRESIDAISALVGECRLHISEKGFSTRAVDTSNVAMISLELDAGAFQSFNATELDIGLDIAKLKNILGMVGKNDQIDLELDAESKKLAISFKSYRYSISLLDTKTIRKDPNPPSLNLPAVVRVSGETLNSAIKAASVVSDKIALKIEPENSLFIMLAEGDTDNIKLELGKDDVEFVQPAEARSLFSLDYLKDMGKVIGRSDTVEIQLGIDHPVQFLFTIAQDKGRVTYLLAPRIEAD
ncbi:MAG: DNA polymerase sliding clamp [Methanomicrobiales archaeon 53_19]|uniref:DNA polymerase sliding clamp n=1 Tax=Methanocalculus sp. TaxID=2004547 RepID=UPI0007482131|nr:DNA polymerase sliding clamp [Methanocalculus sp.]KUK69827.1 MAG: DNA polymerase sliding clamp [Methanocalculus sp. 52_23]KUL04298.1 MAG: DNA polymerase sliding clamp [Methanomicrobiales archaeon 53_19]HIJ06053.1 DNA polymerase sliding clamp [Methanocalculus sp.]